MGTEIASRNYTPEVGSSSAAGGGGAGGGEGGSASIPLATSATPVGTPPVSLDIWTDTDQQQINGKWNDSFDWLITQLIEKLGFCCP